MYHNVPKNIVHINTIEGHRHDYADLFSKLFDLKKSFGSTRGIEVIIKLISANKLLFASLDDDVFGFVLIALVRAFIGRKTVALFIRPQSCFECNVKGRLKYGLFNILRRVGLISIFTILPHTFINNFRKISTGWVHDPQMWDLLDIPEIDATPLSNSLLQAAEERKIIIFLGRVSLDKGINTLTRIISDFPSLCNSFFFVIAGRVDSGVTPLLMSIDHTNVAVIDRFLEGNEIDSLYKISDQVWCCYDKSYDQASGIFGRAVQRKKIVIVREGSLISGIAKHYAIPSIEIREDKLSEAVARMSDSIYPFKCVSAERDFYQWKVDFCRKIKATL